MFIFQIKSAVVPTERELTLNKTQNTAIKTLKTAKDNDVITLEQYNTTKTRVNNAKNSQEVVSALQDLANKNDKFKLYFEDFYRWYGLQQGEKYTRKADDWFAPAEATMRYDMTRRAKEMWEQDQDIVKVREKAQAPKKK